MAFAARRRGHCLPVLTVELPDSLDNQLIEQWMWPQRRPQTKFDVRMTPAQFVAGRCQISPQMNPVRKKVRDHQNPSCAELYAAIATDYQLRMGDLEKARFDNWVPPLPSQSSRQLVQIVVSTLLATPVCNQQYGRPTIS
jgi:hypothetical protein